ncbi:MAG: hypothetical protein KJZ86_20360 [Caldilineaceae bacterium]|nr:hypothetical protein [Caldilineaceae bacterium]
MTTYNSYDSGQWDESEALLAYYNQKFSLPQQRIRNKPPKPSNQEEKMERERELVDTVTADRGIALGLEITYTPARFEAEWLLDSLRNFFLQDLITDVMAQVKGGKEASVYRCVPHPTVDAGWLAAKVYRPRQFRNLRNDAMYREGRQILTDEDGKPADPKDDRIIRAIGKKSAFGVQVQHTSWLMHEFTTLQKLYNAGAAVPRPVAADQNAILMGYIGDGGRGAPTLHETALSQAEAGPLFHETMRNIEIMLDQGYIHGDLSAYNILYWEGKITLIDFPQVTNARGNRSARKILDRDVRRVCDYFARFGVNSNPAAITEKLWKRYAEPDPMDYLADMSRIEAEREEE